MANPVEMNAIVVTAEIANKLLHRFFEAILLTEWTIHMFLV